jgi:hypothetical protein
MPEDIITHGLPHKKLKPALDKIKNRVFKHKVVKDMLKKYEIDESELDLVPICFARLPVSARTDHGVIYINIDLAQDGNILEDDHYIAHELTHYCQQTTGNKPTPTADPENYLDSPVEQEGFRNQSKYIADTKGEEAAKDYIDDVLDYHEKTNKDKKKREDRKDCLLAVARDFDVDLSEFA